MNLIAEGEQITFQTFDDTKGRHARHLVHVLHGTLEQHLPLLTKIGAVYDVQPRFIVALWGIERRCCPNQPASHDFPSPG